MNASPENASPENPDAINLTADPVLNQFAVKMANSKSLGNAQGGWGTAILTVTPNNPAGTPKGTPKTTSHFLAFFAKASPSEVPSLDPAHEYLWGKDVLSDPSDPYSATAKNGLGKKSYNPHAHIQKLAQKVLPSDDVILATIPSNLHHPLPPPAATFTPDLTLPVPLDDPSFYSVGTPPTLPPVPSKAELMATIPPTVEYAPNGSAHFFNASGEDKGESSFNYPIKGVQALLNDKAAAGDLTAHGPFHVTAIYDASNPNIPPTPAGSFSHTVYSAGANKPYIAWFTPDTSFTPTPPPLPPVPLAEQLGFGTTIDPNPSGLFSGDPFTSVEYAEKYYGDRYNNLKSTEIVDADGNKVTVFHVPYSSSINKLSKPATPKPPAVLGTPSAMDEPDVEITNPTYNPTMSSMFPAEFPDIHPKYMEKIQHNVSSVNGAKSVKDLPLMIATPGDARKLWEAIRDSNYNDESPGASWRAVSSEMIYARSQNSLDSAGQPDWVGIREVADSDQGSGKGNTMSHKGGMKEVMEGVTRATSQSPEWYDSAKQFLRFLHLSPPESPELWRGSGRDGTKSSVLATYSPGYEFDMLPSPWSENKSTANGFSGNKPVQVVYHVKKGSRSIPVKNINSYGGEAEWMAGGRYKVLSSTDDGSRIRIEVEQIATFDPDAKDKKKLDLQKMVRALAIVQEHGMTLIPVTGVQVARMKVVK